MKSITIYTDGSYYDDTEHAGWAFVAGIDDKVLHYECGTCTAESRQIGGELMAAYNGVVWALTAGYDHVNIAHDYTGVAYWLIPDPKFGKPWKASKGVAVDYVRNMMYFIDKISFTKVIGHSGHPFNDLADILASRARKESLEEVKDFARA